MDVPILKNCQDFLKIYLFTPATQEDKKDIFKETNMK
jgi:hypothetical protein